MSSPVQSFPVVKASVVRKPVARKAVGGASLQNGHENTIEPLRPNPTPSISHSQRSPSELQGSPVSPQPQPSQAASSKPTTSSAVVPPLLQSTADVSRTSSDAATLRWTVNSGLGIVNQAGMQNTTPEVSAGSNRQPNAVVGSASSPTTAQSKTNQARRMQRRTMMMSVTANVGSTHMQDVPQQFTAPSAPPVCISPAGPLVSRPPSKTEPATHALHPHSSAEKDNSRLAQPAISTGHLVPSGLTARKPLPLMPYPSLSSQIQGSAIPHIPAPQTRLPAKVLSGQQNFVAQQDQKITEYRAAVLPAANSKPQLQNVLSPLLAFSSAQSRPANQRSMSIQSIQTVSSVTSLRSSPNSELSITSPMTNVATPSTVYSPLTQAPKASTVGPDTCASYFSICSSCKIGKALTL